LPATHTPVLPGGIVAAISGVVVLAQVKNDLREDLISSRVGIIVYKWNAKGVDLSFESCCLDGDEIKFF
jgi:hypothetical protein